MRTISRPSLQLERLEARDCPTVSLKYIAGNLIITGRPTGDLIIEGSAGGPNVFTVTDNGKALGKFALPGSLLINMPSRPGRLEINLNNKFIGGNVLLNLGRGFTGKAITASDIDIYDSNATSGLANGTIRGSLTVLNGNGEELVNIGAHATNVPLPVTEIRPIRILGNLTAAARVNANKVDGLQLGEGSIVRGNVTVTNYEEVALGLQDITLKNTTIIGKNVSITTAGVGQGVFADIYGTVQGNVYFNAAASTANSNTLTLSPPDPDTNDTVIGGSVFARFGSALVNNQFSLLSAVGNPSTSIIQGNLQIISTAGLNSIFDLVNIQGTIFGSASINLGDGDNNFTFTDTGFIGGNLSLWGGNGTNNFGTNGNVFEGVLGGSLHVTVGNGDNQVGVQTGIGGMFFFRGGNGTNLVEILPTSPALFSVKFLFGTGTNQLDLNNDVTLTGLIAGSPGASNTFNINGATLLPTLVLVNWP